jgi:hypothetical protein
MGRAMQVFFLSIKKGERVFILLDLEKRYAIIIKLISRVNILKEFL